MCVCVCVYVCVYVCVCVHVCAYVCACMCDRGRGVEEMTIYQPHADNVKFYLKMFCSCPIADLV